MDPSIDREQVNLNKQRRETDRRDRKDRKMQSYKKQLESSEVMNFSTAEPLKDVNLPDADELRAAEPSLYHDFKCNQDQCSDLYETSKLSTDKGAVVAFIDKMHELSEEQGRIYKRARTLTMELKDLPESKRAAIIRDINKDEQTLLKYRTRLASGKRKLSGDILSQTPVSRIGTAFLDHFLSDQNIEWIAGTQIDHATFAQMRKMKPRSGTEQTNFRNTLWHTYSNVDKTDPETGESMCWDPVSGGWLPPDRMTAAHIVPLSVGEFNYAALIGARRPETDDIWQAMWSSDNGMMLHERVERALDQGSIVIVPDETGSPIPEYKLVILLQDARKIRLDELFSVDNHGNPRSQTIGDFDNRKLTWINDNRPGATNLYMRYVFTRLARKRLLAQGWECDIEKVPRSKAWAGVGPLRHRMLRVLAEEMGDFVPDEDSGGSFPGSVMDDASDIPAIEDPAGNTEAECTMALDMAHGVQESLAEEE